MAERLDIFGMNFSPQHTQLPPVEKQWKAEMWGTGMLA